MEMLFPKSADNNYQGHKIVFFIFIPFLLLMTWRSIIHMFFAEFGLHEIANVKVLSGEPDPMPLIYSFFSVWGFIQLILCLLSWIVLIRYRSLIPLIIFSFLVEWSARTLRSDSILNNPLYSGSDLWNLKGAKILRKYFLFQSLKSFHLSTSSK